MAQPKGSTNKPNPHRPNFWGFLNNLFYNAINKGQLLPLGILFFGLIFILRIPKDELGDFGSKLIHAFESWHLLGWVIALVEALLGFVYFKRVRKTHSDEIDRIAQSKKQFQEAALGKKLGSSNKH